MKMRVPSGRIFDELDLELIEMMVKYKFIEYKDTPFTLSSGRKSNVYVFGREDVTDHPDFEWLIGKKIAFLVRSHNFLFDDKQVCLIGIPTAGTAMAQAASMVSYLEGIFVNGYPICHRIMREALKTHGAHKSWVNGPAQPEIHSYWTLDNVVTDAASKFEAAKRLKESGYPAQEMPTLVFVDRQQGGIERMKQGGFTHIVVGYYLLDLTFAFGELGLWPKEKVRAVEEEIKANQTI